jgi:hypothetical protein
MMSIKKGVDHDGSVWGRDSSVHQTSDFLPHITQHLLSMSPMFMLVNR